MTISSSIGPISGIDYGKLITGLIGLEQRPIDKLTTRLENLDKQNNALLSISTMLTGLRISSANFTSSAVFRSATATTANSSVLAASAGVGTPTGNYAFNVQRLASASQQVTQGFADSTSALGLSGAIKMQLGGGRLDDAAKLTSLNGGSGVARGSIRVTDRTGASTLIDLTHAVDINDVVNTINSTTGVNILAKIDGDRLVLTDNTGAAGTLTVTNAGGTTTAADLGLTAPSVNGVLTGITITKLKAGTSLDALNDGTGVRTAGLLNDFSIAGVGGTVEVSLNGAKTIGEAISKINTAGQAVGLSAAISADGLGITLTDTGGGPVTVTALNSSLAAADLGIAGTSGAGTLAGDRISSTLIGPLIKNLRGGYQGPADTTTPTFGALTINGETIDLTAARTLDEALKTINTNTQGVTATINGAGTGITLSSSAATFTVADTTGNLAAFFNVAGTSTVTASGSEIQSGDLRLRYISENTRLSTLNGGSGVRLGNIRITDGTGSALTLDLTGSDITSIGSVLKRINSSGLAINARINDTGDGILLAQTSGTTNGKVEDLNGGTTAKDLGILGDFNGNQLNGTFQKSISIAASDKLSDIAKKINDANAGVSVSIINDGSGATPYRLSFASRNSGVAGRLIFDGSAAGLSTTSLVQGQDAVLIYGGNASGTGGLLASSSNNVFSSLVPGLTLTLNGVGSTSVTVNRDDGKIKDSVQSFVDGYNKVIENIAEVTKFDAAKPADKGVLFGNSTVQQIQDALGLLVSKVFGKVGTVKTLGSVGITVGRDGKLSFDADKFAGVLASNPDDVRALFTSNIKAVTGGARVIATSTLLTSLTSNGVFPSGHISITDGFGAAHDIDLSSGVTTIADIISRINSGTAGTVTAGINSTGNGLLLTQVGGSGTPQVDEVSGGTTAATLNIKGAFTGGALNGAFLPTTSSPAVKGVGATLADLLERFTNAQTGLIFKSTDSIATQERQLKSRQTALAELLEFKKTRLIKQFAGLEVNIAQLQRQGTALASFKSVTSSSS